MDECGTSSSDIEMESNQEQVGPDWCQMLRDNTFHHQQENKCLMPVTFEHVEHTYKKYVKQLATDKWSKETCAICQEGAKKKHYLLHISHYQ